MKNFKHYHLSNIKWYYFFVCCTFIVLWTSKVSQLLFVPTNTEIITKHIFQVISDTTYNNCWSCIWTQTTRLLSDQIIYIKKEFVGNLFSRPRLVKRKRLYTEKFQLLVLISHSFQDQMQIISYKVLRLILTDSHS